MLQVQIPPFTSACKAGIPSKPDVSSVTKCRGYLVQGGDSLSSIALKVCSSSIHAQQFVCFIILCLANPLHIVVGRFISFSFSFRSPSPKS
jgi:hypothetical protein